MAIYAKGANYWTLELFRTKCPLVCPARQILLYYASLSYSADLLTMLGVKTTCKDRWRQVLAEARRIERKHLLTLETAISGHQTDEMRDNHLQLVVPRSLHGTFTASQQQWLLDVAGFTEIVREREKRAAAS